MTISPLYQAETHQPHQPITNPTNLDNLGLAETTLPERSVVFGFQRIGLADFFLRWTGHARLQGQHELFGFIDVDAELSNNPDENASDNV
jgi:hypothetical protein